MRVYSAGHEEKIHTRRQVEQWREATLLSGEQAAAIAAQLRVAYQQANNFIRLVLFIFGSLIIIASVLLTIELFSIQGHTAVAMLCFVTGALCAAITAVLIDRFRLYRYGVEEAAAVGSVALMAIGCAVLSEPRDFLAGLVAGSLGFTALYFRYGYLYCGFGAVSCIIASAFQLNWSSTAERLAAASLAYCIFFALEGRRGHDVPALRAQA